MCCDGVCADDSLYLEGRDRKHSDSLRRQMDVYRAGDSRGLHTPSDEVTVRIWFATQEYYFVPFYMIEASYIAHEIHTINHDALQPKPISL